MRIKVTTTTRIDFAGGTLDLYPLYLFMRGGLTVNAGITIRSYVEISPREDTAIHILSEDLKREAFFPSIKDLDFQGPTALIQEAIRFFAPTGGIDVVTFSEAPRGSGLGASSSLLAGLFLAFVKYKGEDVDIPTLIDWCASVEAAHLGVPTGKQDYYGAIFGGINALYFDEKGDRREGILLPERVIKELNDSLIISFTGISHYSGANNWEMLKGYIENRGDVRKCLHKIKDVTYKLRSAFSRGDIEEVGHLVKEEWSYRKRLAFGVTTSFIEEAMSTLEEIGAWGSKLCGAGGGGCMLTLAPPEVKDKIKDKLTEMGIEPMDATIDYEGFKIDT